MVVLKVMQTLGKCVILVGILAAVIAFAPGIPPHMNFEAFSLTPALPLEGKLAPNSILDKAEPLAIDRSIGGPESIAFRGDELFTGLKNGDIIKVKNGKVSTVVKTGFPCQGRWDARVCGRPLGMRFDAQGKLIVADTYYGILRVDVDKGTKEFITSTSDLIDGIPPTFPNDLDIDEEGNIYWSDVNTCGGKDLAICGILGEPSGRLIKYNIKEKTSEFLMKNIHSPNGVQLSSQQDFIMISEFARARILRYFLKGPRKGESEVFVDGLPGLPDNIRPTGRGGYYIGLAIPRIPGIKPVPGDALGGKPLQRKVTLRLQSILLGMINIIETFVGESVFTQESRLLIQNLGTDPAKMQFHPKVILVEIDETGVILGSLQNQNGKIAVIGEVAVGPVFTYFGSPVADQIWRMNTSDLFTEVHSDN